VWSAGSASVSGAVAGLFPLHPSGDTDDGWTNGATATEILLRQNHLNCGHCFGVTGNGNRAAVYFGYRYAKRPLKSSEAYTVAVTALKENPEVRDKMGEITDTGFPLGAFSQNSDGSGDAAFNMSVQGSKGTGRYAVELKRRNGVWKLESGNVRLSNGDIIQVADRSMNYVLRSTATATPTLRKT